MSGSVITKPQSLFATSVAGDRLIALPTIRNLEESCALAHHYSAVLTAGPRPQEVADFAHPNHRVWSFGDTTGGYGAPTRDQIKEAIVWGAVQDDLLVHCHAGISRSTATAWGVSILKGADPLEAVRVLSENHPHELWPEYGTLFKSRTMMQRPFAPNRLIVSHLEDILGFRKDYLSDILQEAGVSYYF